MDYELIAKALFESYECIYDIDLNTSAYRSMHESEAYRKLNLDREGEDFFAVLPEKIAEVIVPEDRDYVLRMLTKENLIRGLEREKNYSFLYRIQRDGEGVYHRIRATLQPMEDGMHVFMGVTNVDRVMRREKERLRLKQELQMARIRNFTGQMQPHFLYNALGSIQEVIHIDPEYASELLGYFTVHLRSCIRAMNKDEPVPFAQELENIEAYVNIEKMRFGKKLRVHFDTPARDFRILPLTVQPLIENSIRHGIYGRGTKGGDVWLATREEKNAWIVEVGDNGVGFDVEEYRKKQARGAGDSTGLRNIKVRLKELVGASIDVVSRVGEGTLVRITIPKEVERDASHNSG